MDVKGDKPVAAGGGAVGGGIDVANTFQCSPALHRRGGETCLPAAAIARLVRYWNRSHPRNKIRINMTRKASGGAKMRYAAALYKKLRELMRVHHNCYTEYCMIKKLPMPEDDRKKMLAYFRPEKPAVWDKKGTLWLDSYNIEDVMRQYEEAEPHFEFIGPVPIDFDKPVGGIGKRMVGGVKEFATAASAGETVPWDKCVVTELCKLDLDKLIAEGKRKIGIIFNLDPHDKPGSHWVCAFVDMDRKAVYYFDSYGYAPQREIKIFLARLKNQGITNLYYNDIRHQKKGSECGMYCLFCIICLLRGRNFFDICSHIIDDDTMNLFRDILFAEETPRKEAIEEGLKKVCT
jgi:hypothetical protein